MRWHTLMPNKCALKTFNRQVQPTQLFYANKTYGKRFNSPTRNNGVGL